MVVLLVAKPSLASAPNATQTPISQNFLVQQSIPPTATLPIPKPKSYAVSDTGPSTSEVRAYIEEVFGKDAPRAIRIASCESSLQWWRINDTPSTGDYSIGIFQINLYGSLAKNRPSKEWLLNYKNNIDYAYKMYKAQGWTPWSCK